MFGPLALYVYEYISPLLCSELAECGEERGVMVGER